VTAVGSGVTEAVILVTKLAMQSLFSIIDTTMYSRLLLHTFLVVVVHRKVVVGQYHGTYHPSAPRVAIGPYRPWEGRFPPPLHLPGRLPASHPGYQTNIVIDQTGKAGNVVEITTEDLSTGLEVGKTEWSGPGTLTLSAIASFLESPRQRKRDSPHELPGTHRYPAGHPKAEFELVEVPRSYEEPLQSPEGVMGKPCTYSQQCTKALHAVCSANTQCQEGVSCPLRTCQCPPSYHLHLNTHRREGVTQPRRKRRSLRYYEECRYHPRLR